MLKGAGGGGGGITPGTTVITGGTNTRVLFDDNGVVGEDAGLTYVKGTGTLSATNFSGAGAFTTLSASSTVSGAGFSAYLASPPAIGGTTPAAGTFTGLTAISATQLAPALTAGNWTVGAGWESPIVGPGLIKNADGTGTQTPSAATNIVAGTTYKVTITLSAASVGSATYTLGAVTGASTLSAATTYTDYVTASTTGKLIITPTNTSRFTISAISILAVGDYTGTIGKGNPTPGSFTTLSATGAITGGGNIVLHNGQSIIDVTTSGISNGDFNFSHAAYLDANSRGIRLESGGAGVMFNSTAVTIPGTADTNMSRVSPGVMGFGTGAAGSVAGTVSAAAYISGGSAGVDFGPSVVTSITVKKGIITAIS